MNQQLLEIIAKRPDFNISAEDKKVVEFFTEYMDHNSLWLLRFESSEDPKFVFTNDAQRFTFSLSQINRLYNNMKSGIALNWDEMPFEYISPK